jgi:hypothetical protein
VPRSACRSLLSRALEVGPMADPCAAGASNLELRSPRICTSLDAGLSYLSGVRSVSLGATADGTFIARVGSGYVPIGGRRKVWRYA